MSEDKLGYRHVMGDSTLLPNGKIMLHGGAQVGKGWGQGARHEGRGLKVGSNGVKCG